MNEENHKMIRNLSSESTTTTENPSHAGTNHQLTRYMPTPYIERTSELLVQRIMKPCKYPAQS